MSTRLEQAKQRMAELTPAMSVRKARTEAARLMDLSNAELAELCHSMVDDVIRRAPEALGALEEVIDRRIFVAAHFERGTMLVTKATLKVIVTLESDL